MKQTFLYFILLVAMPIGLRAQFHTMTMPNASPHVIETQELGVTKITVDYYAPSVRGRKVFETVVPFEGDPIPWRAGANMNTRIKFSTDVKINGVDFPAGSYGYHIIPRKNGPWEILFASNDNLWGSYYLDTKKDIYKEIKVEPTTCAFQEIMNFDFNNRTDSTVVVALQWEETSIPLTLEVDLNKTVLSQFRSELRGINTYRWEAWNDAARWCLNRNINLEEALSWADRSINGGYGGFAANKNINNMQTKVELMYRLKKTAKIPDMVDEAKGMIEQPHEAYYFGEALLKAKAYPLAKDFFAGALEKYPDVWYIPMSVAATDYLMGKKKEAIKAMEALETSVDSRTKNRVQQIKSEMEAGTFQIKD